ncbi:MAG: hypothetical protein QT05_C0012G0004 [archaeon GW2011_AR13]|nr:MAG: hypothetical protein QT05_C0012G0004 [archaeon GW2011_AR13]HIG94038.1 hypothetical protein [Nanoarchaeota archaeon]HIH63770.1 hypothetical protein [Nanoarchaeota archaeon]HIJ09643.1 hypothetical protein [Nanoarchaeota archaeon]
MRNFILFFGILILFSFNINANFVCGIVENSDDGMSGAWFNTRLFYENYSSNFLNCQVSPKENKYCCDADSIYPQNTWKVGKKVFARVYDFNTGYFADEVNVITTGRAYDIFPNLKLKKAIKVNDPVSRVIISKENNLSLNLSFSEPYNLIEIRDENSLLFNCDNCTFFNDSLNLSFGENKINVFAKKINNESFQEVINVALIEDFDFERSFDCGECKKKIRGAQNVTMSLALNLSNDVDGVLLKEYVPIEWSIMDAGFGIIKDFDSNYNLIEWNLSGKNFTFDYIVKSPDVGIFQQEFLFGTNLEYEILNEENILVYKVVPVSLPKFSFSSDSSEGSSGWGRPPAKKNESSKNQISPSHPLVIDLNDSFVKRLVIYPKTEMIVENFNLDSYFKENLIDGLIQIYSYDSSLIQDNFEKVGVEFKISKDFLLKNNFEKINLYTLDNGFSLANLSLYSEDDNNLYYRGFIEFKEGFAIAGVTNNSISEDLSNKVTGLSIFEEIDLKESFLFKFFIKIKNFFSEIKL